MRDSYTIVRPKKKLCSIRRAVFAGDYDLADGISLSKRFPWDWPGKKKQTATLVHLDEEAEGSDVLVAMIENNIRPATMAELLIFGAEYKSFQRSYPIVALGQSYQPRFSKNIFVGCLSSFGICNESRKADAVFDGLWPKSTRFLAIRQ